MAENKRIIGWLELTLLQIIEEYKSGSNEPLDGDNTERLSDVIKAKIDLQEGNITHDEYDAIIDNTATNSEIKYLFIDLEVREGERTHNHRVLIQTKLENVADAVEDYASDYWGESTKEENFFMACNDEISIRVRKYKLLDKKTYDIMHDIFYAL